MRVRMLPQERCEQLIAFGREHFSQHAVDSFSMEEIAEKAGVTKGLIYKYFGDRHGFYLAVLRSLCDEVILVLSHEINREVNGDFDKMLARLLTNIFQFATDNPAISLIVMDSAGADSKAQAELVRIKVWAAQWIFQALDNKKTTAIETMIIDAWISSVHSGAASVALGAEITVTAFTDFYVDSLNSNLAYMEKLKKANIVYS